MPSACRPASSTALLTCALGTSGSKSIAIRRALPSIVSGGRPPEERNPGAHAFERHDDALHRPALQRGVAGDGRAERMGRENPGQHTHRAAGIAGVEHLRRRDQSARTASPHGDPHSPRDRCRPARCERRAPAGSSASTHSRRRSNTPGSSWFLRPSPKRGRSDAKWICRRAGARGHARGRPAAPAPCRRRTWPNYSRCFNQPRALPLISRQSPWLVAPVSLRPRSARARTAMRSGRNGYKIRVPRPHSGPTFYNRGIHGHVVSR